MEPAWNCRSGSADAGGFSAHRVGRLGVPEPLSRGRPASIRWSIAGHLRAEQWQLASGPHQRISQCRDAVPLLV